MNNLTEKANGNVSFAATNYNELRVIKFIIYLLICLFSVTGNTLVILSVIFFKRLKTVPNIFIANLAACDLVTTLSSIPFDLPAEELGYWPYGEAMCKILWPLATFTTTSAAFTLVSISADRYGALCHPLNFRYKITRRKCAFVMGFVYFLAALAVSPYLVFLRLFPPDGPDGLPQCGEDWPELQLRKSYTVFLFAIQYGIPLVIMTYIYFRLGCLLQKNTRKAGEMSSKKNPPQRKISQYSTTSGSSQCSLQRRKEQNDKTVKMFFVIVMIFLVFMLPNQILWILYDFGNSQELFDHIDLVAFVCRAFTYTNSVLNALVYGACNISFRRAFKAIIRCKCGKSHQREDMRSRSIKKGRFSEMNSTRTRSPPIARDSPKRTCNTRFKKTDSCESIEGSFNSDTNPTSPGNSLNKYYKTDLNGSISTKRLIKHDDRDYKSMREKKTNSVDNKGQCNGIAKEKYVNINNNIQIFTFEDSKETKL
ncbi:neuropeptide FF receptor 1 [Exaiptasia diaphana]|uniref:G-protein coupled receptors family 1 profile domain-containing protein n=1 Tax=Exaiptasia diaphana TaxID=2652724 RepID=A0A913WRF6_EXADI|nr:neuropeptide FF receptor 1 [Exaiptasia diaphana]XP_020892985.1 neuropeptide FF receptor 1 [Exaiptasia diaphana]XP_020892994.1 neuropeptide FF receptor 1 [Exaiptasia diaphana]XP_028512858.1 neuropeptide FF receptor 1 [Exaiptasia diaphana]XP_028512862.1 neuropeptide FF receptor 1 [Exaiptasia diaphana]